MFKNEFATNAGTLIMLDSTLIASLQERSQGEIIRPPDEGYEATRKIWNAMIDKRPALIARCKNSQDVILRTTFAAHNSSLDAGQPAGMHYYWKSEYVTGLPDAAIEILVTFAASMTSPYSRINIFQLGGLFSAILSRPWR